MKTRINIIFALLLIGLLQQTTLGQDVYYSIPAGLPTYYNPAYTGVNTGLRARFTYRNQWPSLPVPYKSYFFTADIGDRNLPGAGGIGVYVNSNNDGVGFIHDLQAGLTIGVRIPITERMISQLGVKAAYGQRTISAEDYIWPSQLNKIYGFQEGLGQSDFVENKSIYPDFGAGGLIQFINEPGTISGTAGIAIDHLFQPDISFTQDPTFLNRKWVIHADFVYSAQGSPDMSAGGFRDPLKVNPGVIYQVQNGVSNLQVGLTAMKFNIYLGGWIKTTMNAGQSSYFTLLGGFRYVFSESMAFRFLYAYDIQMSHTLYGTGGAHEISLVIDFKTAGLTRGGNNVFGSGNRPSGYLECPQFY